MGAVRLLRIAMVITFHYCLSAGQVLLAQGDQDSVANLTQAISHSYQIALQRGFWLSGDAGQPGALTTLGFACIPTAGWWKPSFHASISYADYQYSRGLTDRTITRVRAISISPSVKLFRVLVFGVSYSNGKKEETRFNQSLFRNETTEESLSRFSGIAALEIDVRVYRRLYLSGGYAYVSPYGYALLGVAWRFDYKEKP